MVHKKKTSLKVLTFMCALALVASTLGNGFPNMHVHAAELQEVAGGDFLNGSTVSGEIGKVIVDKATNTFTSGAKTGTVFINMCDAEGGSISFKPGSGAVLEYDFEITGDAAYISPVNPNSYGYAVGNKFIDEVISTAGIEISEDKKLPAGHYTGSVTPEDIGWDDNMSSDSAMIRLFPETKLVINKMRFVEQKTALTDTAGGNLTALYKSSVINGTEGIIADDEAGIFTSGSSHGGFYIDLYKNESERAAIAPSDGDLLYYDFTVSMVEHDFGDENHAYHGRAEIVPNSWGNGSSDITAAFMNAVAKNSGIELVWGRLPVGNYTGTADLSEVWTSDNTTNCITLWLGEYTKVVIRALKFVSEKPIVKIEDQPDGDLLAGYYELVPSNNTITVDKATNTVASHEAWGSARLDFYTDESKGERRRVYPQSDALLYYDFTVSMVEHDCGNVNHAYHGKANVSPKYEEGGTPVKDAFMDLFKSDGKEFYGKLYEGEYKGTIDLSSVWSSDEFSDCILFEFNEYAAVTLNELKFVVPSVQTEILDYTAGYSITGNSTADYGSIISDQSGRVFTTGEGYGPVVLTAANQILSGAGTKLYYDFEIEMTEHTPDDEAHAYHGRASVNITVPSLNEAEAAELSGALMNGIAENAGTEVWLETLPAGKYSGTVDLSAVWGPGKPASGMSFRLNNFTRVTLNEFKLVSEPVIAEGDVNGDGYVNSQDLAAMRKYLLGAPSTLIEEYGDLNNDGVIDIRDMINLKKKIAYADRYGIETPPLEPVIIPQGFSIAPVMPGSSEFAAGSLYKGETLDFRKESDSAVNPTVGMWIWDCRMVNGTSDDSDMTPDELLDMLIQNGVTEVYIGMRWYMPLAEQLENGGVLKDGFIGETQLRGFVKKCAAYGIRTAVLTTLENDTYREWTRDPDESKEYSLTKKWVRLIADFNSRASGEDERIYGLHTDLEPDWENGGDGLSANLQSCADYLIRMRRYSDFYGVELSFDISAFLREEWKAYDENGEYVSILDIFTKQCRQLTLMSYRQTAELQYELGETELKYAVKNGCQLILGAETGNTSSEPGITYYGHSAEYLKQQQSILREMLEDSGCDSFGIAIHHAVTFADLMTAEK